MGTIHIYDWLLFCPYRINIHPVAKYDLLGVQVLVSETFQTERFKHVLKTFSTCRSFLSFLNYNVCKKPVLNHGELLVSFRLRERHLESLKRLQCWK